MTSIKLQNDKNKCRYCLKWCNIIVSMKIMLTVISKPRNQNWILIDKHVQMFKIRKQILLFLNRRWKQLCEIGIAIMQWQSSKIIMTLITITLKLDILLINLKADSCKGHKYICYQIFNIYNASKLCTISGKKKMLPSSLLYTMKFHKSVFLFT